MKPDESDIRALIRQLIREALPDAVGGAEVRRISIGTDTELASFVESILILGRDEDQLGRYRSGSLQFAWAHPGGPQDTHGVVGPPGSTSLDVPGRARAAGPELRVDKGAVTERLLARALAEGSTVVAGKGAVLTPLAREFARKNGMSLESPS